MSHREKVAWLSLIAMVVTMVPYLGFTSALRPTQLSDAERLILLAVALVAQALILGIGHLWLRLGNPQEARSPADERDREVERRSLGVAYYVLIAGFVLVGCVMPFTESGWTVVNAAIGAIVLAEVVHQGLAVWIYRQGFGITRTV